MASEGVGKVNAISSKCEFKWEIDKFCMGCKDVGDYLESPKFVVSSIGSEIHWFLRLFPKGETKDDKNYLSLYLHASGEIKAGAKLKIFDKKGIEVVNRNMSEHTFKFGEANRGYSQFISRDLIMNPGKGILNDDKLTIVCKIKMSACDEKEVKIIKYAEELEGDFLPRLQVIADKYEALLNDSKFSDLSLIAEGKAVKAHKCILAKSSSVFAAMFDAEMKERQENTVEIDDIEYDVLLEMVRFVYTGKVNDIDSLADKLAIAADKYELEELKDTCEKTMMKNLSLHDEFDVFDCLRLADTLCMDKLKEKAIEFIVENAIDAIEETPADFKLLSADILREICFGLAKKNR